MIAQKLLLFSFKTCSKYDCLRRTSLWPKAQLNSFISTRDYHRKKVGQLIEHSKDVMVKLRVIKLPIPFSKSHKSLNNLDSFTFTLSNVAGHGAFLFLAISYMESEFLELRLYAISGLALSIIFQYYREKPLWIPIRWNFLFLIINLGMVGLIIKDENDAKEIPGEQKELFDTVFQAKGMKPVDFLHLMSIARRETFKKGEKVMVQGEYHDTLHLVQSGSFIVCRSKYRGVRSIVGRIEKHQFVGSMAFVNWEGENSSREITRRNKVMELQSLYTLDHPNDFLWNIFSAQTNATDELHVLTAASTGTGTGAYSDSSRGFKSSADAVCVEDCVAYSWTFSELHDLLSMEPRLGVAFELTVSSDLNKKMVTTWIEEPKMIYREVLGAVVIDGEITNKKKDLLRQYRLDYGISDEEHSKCISDLGWTAHDFAMGYQGGALAGDITKYGNMLKETLLQHQDKVLSFDEKNKLYRFRKDHNIDGATQLLLLKQFGWTLDDYECGSADHTDRSTVNTVSSPIPTPTTYLSQTKYWNWFPMFSKWMGK